MFTSINMIKITANGETFSIEDGTSLPDFLAERGQAPERVVVERNGEALTQSDAKAATLASGDVLEIVRIVAGG
ncbi:sulfur carrier protein ThiS [Cerasicoccus maritimus]|uniref:sulfur carrier protein ThiS n=1 Tax=Cerasicoccus maritimus TaxID=490089 RepID=UPI002852CE18|nr:sulfur carrier protein ThiS [Cerasicoccus maritimus]